VALQDATSATVVVTSTDALMDHHAMIEIPVTNAAMDHHVMTEMVASQGPEEAIVARHLGMTGTREEKIRREINATR
jgi:hypothetical protein